MRWTGMVVAGLLLTGWALWVLGQRVQAQATPKPNIIFILTDDHRWDTLGCMGHPFLQTPNIDRIAAEGAKFTNAFVTT
ncbi:MAG: sulfatase-like hydrolase/transferase, partial [Meiothermus silvanus]|nr:sulfatase-like hydrolase/transferase [Allomeiothermus silvanus]